MLFLPPPPKENISGVIYTDNFLKRLKSYINGDQLQIQTRKIMFFGWVKIYAKKSINPILDVVLYTSISGI